MVPFDPFNALLRDRAPGFMLTGSSGSGKTYLMQVIALNLAYLIVGVVLVEVVFVYPGLGQLLVDSVAKRDFPVVQAACLIFAATYILLNLAADLIAILSNPRLLHPR